MRICTAPTVFDGLDREKIIAWLEQEPTIALLAALDERIRELTDIFLRIDLTADDTEIGGVHRAVRYQIDAHKQLREWTRQAETRAREVQHGKA
jgi:hypothetical protein